MAEGQRHVPGGTCVPPCMIGRLTRTNSALGLFLIVPLGEVAHIAGANNKKNLPQELGHIFLAKSIMPNLFSTDTRVSSHRHTSQYVNLVTT